MKGSLPRQPPTEIVAIVVHYGDPFLTLRAVESLLESDPGPSRVIVVDNGPGPFIFESHDRVRVERPGRNLGFAKAVNLAISHEPAASGFWLFNNDAVASRGAFGALIEAANRYPAALVSSVIVGPAGETWFERAAYLPWRMHTRHEVGAGEGRYEVRRTRSWKRVPYLPGTSLLIPRAVIERVGVLDASYFLYGEDVDYCIRAIDAGAALVLARESTVMHEASSGTARGQRERMIAAATLRITARYYPWLVPVGLALSVASAMRRGWRQREPQLPLRRVLGFVDALRRRQP